MFERALHRVLERGIEILDANPTLIGRFMRGAGWTDAEIAKLVALWQTDAGHPKIVHNYARAAGSVPCYAIVMVGAQEADEYLGHGEDANTLEEVTALVDEIQAEIGRQVNISIHQYQYTYQIFTYAENPDVVLAYSNVLRSILIGADKMLVSEFGFERPGISEMDLNNVPPYLPENVFARVTQIVGYAHILCAVDLDLSPWERKFSRIEGMHVQDSVFGVYAGVVPFVSE